MGGGNRCWLAAGVVCVGVVAAGVRVHAVGFNWVDVVIPPNPEMFFSGSWSEGDHWDGAVGFPDDATDSANISQMGVGSFTVTLNLDVHIGGFSISSPDATFEANGRVFRVDGGNAMLDGVVNWINSQVLDSGSGIFNQNTVMNVFGTSLIDVDDFNQNGTLTVQANSTYNTTLTAARGFNNSGSIDVDTTTFTTTRLVLSSGALVNDMASSVLQFSGAGGGVRSFRGDLVNFGIVDVQADARFDRAGDTITNHNLFTISPGVTLMMQTGSQTFNQDGGNLNVLGTFDPQSTTFNFNGGAVTGNAVQLTNSELNIDPAAGGGAFIMRGTGTYSGDLDMDQALTVRADASFNTTATSPDGFTNSGDLTVDTTAGTISTLIVNTNPLLNDAFGLMNFDGAAGTRQFQGDLVNNGIVNINGLTLFNRAGDTFTNDGAFTIATGVTLQMQTGSQVFNQDGVTLDVQGTFNPSAATFNFNGGNVTGNAMTLTNSTLNIAPTAGNGSFIMRSSGTFSGDLAAGQFLTVLGDASANTTVTSNTGLTNASTLTVESTSITSSTLIVNNNPLVNDPARTINFDSTTGGTLQFQGDLVNNGIVNINGLTLFNRAGDTFTNNNQFTVAPTVTLQMQTGSQVFNQDGGTLDVQGTFNPSSTTFNFNGGDVTGNTLVMTNSTLNIDPAAGSGSFIMRSSGTFSGDLAAGQFLTVLGDGTANTTVTSNTGLTNASTLTVESTSITSSTLVVNNSPLVNDPAGTINFTTAAGTLRLRADLVNDGIVNINGFTHFDRAGDTFTNNNQFTVAPGVTLQMQTGSQVFNQDGGTLDVQGTFNPSGATFNFNGGDVTGNTLVMTNSTLNIDPAAGSGSFVMRSSGTFSGDLAAGQSLTVLGDASVNTTITSSSGFTNAGTLAVNTSTAQLSRLLLSGGVLTNDATGLLNFADAGAGLRELRGGLDNLGTVNVDMNATIGDAGQDHLNAGWFNVNAVATVVGDSFINEAGGTIGGTGTLNVSAVDFTNEGGIGPGNSAGALAVTGDVTFTSTGSLAVELGGLDPGNEHDQLNVTGNVLLAGTLDITLIDPYVPMLGHTFTILTAADISGVFETVNTPDIGDNRLMLPIYSPTELVMIATLPGDFDLDGDVDLDDYNILSGNMYTTGAVYTDGDADTDGDVDFEDFVIQALNFGDWPAAEETLSSIPEPGALALFGVGALGLCGRRRGA